MKRISLSSILLFFVLVFFSSFNLASFEYSETKVKHSLHIQIGDQVCIIEQSKDWFRGFKLEDAAQTKGIFPKSFVTLLERPPDAPEFSDDFLPVVDAWELTAVLRSWADKCGSLFSKGKFEDFRRLRDKSYMLVETYHQLNSFGSAEKRTSARNSLYEMIKSEQAYFELPRQPRLPNGRLANESMMPPHELYDAHFDDNVPNSHQFSHMVKTDYSSSKTPAINSPAASTGKSKPGTTRSALRARSTYGKKTLTPGSASIFHVAFEYKACIADFKNEACQLYFSVYDRKKSEFLSEEFMIQLTATGMPHNFEDLSNRKLRTLFTDVDATNRELFIICRIVRHGSLEAEVRKGSPECENKMFRPYGLAVFPMPLKFLTDSRTDSGKPIESVKIQIMALTDESKYKDWVNMVCDNDPALKPMRTDTVQFELITYQGEIKEVTNSLESQGLKMLVTPRPQLPKFILPGTIERHDLYVTLKEGDFSSEIKKKSQKNISVTVEVLKDEGGLCENVIIPSQRKLGQDPWVPFYETIVLKNSTTPGYNDTILIQVPLDLWDTAHMRFTFSYYSNVDKPPKPFAFSYLKFTRDEETTNGVRGVTIRDDVHNLPVYYVNPGTRINRNDSVWYMRPEAVLTLEESAKKKKNKNVKNVLIPLKNDKFSVVTKLVSSKKTHDANLAGLIGWKEINSSKLRDTLKSFAYIEMQDIIKFLQEVFDSLFDIIEAKRSDKRIIWGVFDSFINILVKLSSVKTGYGAKLRPIILAYIDKHFHCASANEVLINLLRESMADPKAKDSKNRIRDSFKSFELLFKFIIKSRLFTQSGRRTTSKDNLSDFFDTLYTFMEQQDKILKTYQTIAIRNIPSIIPDLKLVYSDKKIASILVKFIDSIQNVGDLYAHKLELINTLFKTELMFDDLARRIFLPAAIIHLNKHTSGLQDTSSNSQKDELILITRTIQTFLERIGSFLTDQGQRRLIEGTKFDLEAYNVGIDVNEIFPEPADPDAEIDLYYELATLLPTIFSTLSTLESHATSNSVHAECRARLCCCLTTILHYIPSGALERCIETLSKTMNTSFQVGVKSVIKFLMPICKSWPFPKSWFTINFFMARVFQKFLVALGGICVMQFLVSEYNAQVWDLYLKLVLEFLNMPVLRFERVDKLSGRQAIFDVVSQVSTCKIAKTGILPISGLGYAYGTEALQRYGDLRLRLTATLKKLWIGLDENQTDFLHFGGPFLEMSTMYQPQLREYGIDLYYSTLFREFQVTQNLSKVEQTTIDTIDTFVKRGGMGPRFRKFFNTALTEKLDTAPPGLKKRGLNFLKEITQLLQFMFALSQYPDNPQFEDERSLAMLRLMDYLKRSKRIQMYIKYAQMLAKLHKDVGSDNEAALALRLHADLLSWSTTEFLPELFHYPSQSSFERKEQVLTEMIDNFEKSENWEKAIECIHELREQYEHEQFMYTKIAKLLLRESSLFDKIATTKRFYSNYFRVAFYGMSWDTTVRNKVFVYKGEKLETLVAFVSRIELKYPNATLIRTSKPVSDDVKTAAKKHIQITTVHACKDGAIEGKQPVYHPNMLDFVKDYKNQTNVDLFYFDRPFRKGAKDSQNEFKTLWIAKNFLRTVTPFPGLSRRVDLKEAIIVELSPIQNALKDIQEKTKNLREKIKHHSENDDSANISFFSMCLDGIIDAAVNGGTNKYQDAFFNDTYLTQFPEHKPYVEAMKETLGVQLGFVVKGLELHSRVCGEAMLPMQQKMEQFFAEMEVKMKTELNIVAMNEDAKSPYSGPRLKKKGTESDSNKNGPITAVDGMDFDF